MAASSGHDVREVAEEVGLLDNLRAITAAIRKAGIPVFVVPHHRWEPANYEGWDPPNPDQIASGKMAKLRQGNVGAASGTPLSRRKRGDINKEHWGQSGFANTDLDLRLSSKAHQGDRDRPAGQHVHRIHQPFRDGASHEPRMRSVALTAEFAA